MLWLLMLAQLMVGTASFAGPAYETCTKDNDYLEKDLRIPPVACDDCVNCVGQKPSFSELQAQLRELSEKISFPPECVHVALAGTTQSHAFGTCDPVTGNFKSVKAPRPCVSEQYHLSVYSSFLAAMQCLRIDPREIFPLLYHESNFHVNIGSAHGAWGPGQLTYEAVRATNIHKRIEALTTRPECEAIKEHLKPVAPEHPCEWISGPANPLKNFLYAGSAYLTFRQIAEDSAKGRPQFAALSPEDRKRVVSSLALYMYNGGDGAIRRALSGYLAEKGAVKIEFGVFKDEFKAYLSKHYGEGLKSLEKDPDLLAKKRIEVPQYATAIERDLKAFEKRFAKETGSPLKCSL